MGLLNLESRLLESDDLVNNFKNENTEKPQSSTSLRLFCELYRG